MQIFNIHAISFMKLSTPFEYRGAVSTYGVTKKCTAIRFNEKWLHLHDSLLMQTSWKSLTICNVMYFGAHIVSQISEYRILGWLFTSHVIAEAFSVGPDEYSIEKRHIAVR